MIKNNSETIRGENYRISVLTDGLIRLEYDEKGYFEDRVTNRVVNRELGNYEFRLLEDDDHLEIITDRVHLRYDKKVFSSTGLEIQVKGDFGHFGGTWRYGDQPKTLKGTTRTLDGVDGICQLEEGLISRSGYGVLDDSDSFLGCEDYLVEKRREGIVDLYFFGYGKDYRTCLKDFYRLCGETPLLPRFALGNWWSRYYKYTESSYYEVLDAFEKREIPLSVAVIDMDWHLVDIDEKYGFGWTGYTWNKDLFPDPARFLSTLKNKGLKTTLNVHPADGVRGHEEMYSDMARALGIDYVNEDPVKFDITDPEFVNAYFKYIHHKHEANGVDFWWIDWQQGQSTAIEGVDPLWLLNDYHYKDINTEEKRSIILSRYAGPGSHRYPVGFSGDTVISWESLKFQPYFTSTASNIGYGWWSHDIGGHMFGSKDEELYRRWIQLGVFSPINRLHSTSDEFNTKEPWRFSKKTEEMTGGYLRMRHRLAPYLYTLNYLQHREGLPLVQPMYYEYPDEERAYKVANQFLFGTELMAVPVTSKEDPNTHLASEEVWLPEGLYHDVFTGGIYDGDVTMTMCRPYDVFPLLAKAGSILPMMDDVAQDKFEENPETLKVKVFAGASGSFQMYEDDNVSNRFKDGAYAMTTFNFDVEESSFRILAAEGDLTVLPDTRDYSITFCGVDKNKAIVQVGGELRTHTNTSYDAKNNSLTLTIDGVPSNESVSIRFVNELHLKQIDTSALLFGLLDQAEIDYGLKNDIYWKMTRDKPLTKKLMHLEQLDMSQSLKEAVLEILYLDDMRNE